MSHTSMIVSGLLLMTMVLFFAPNIFALNRGKGLRNVALWLAIFLILALVYKNFGPDSPNPLFKAPASMRGMGREITPLHPAPNGEEKKPQKPVEEQAI